MYFLLILSFVCINYTAALSPPDALCERDSEVYNYCGTCDGTCADPEPSCPEPCKPGCFCAPGYVRNGTQVCILQSNCPPAITCGLNETANICPGFCTFEDDCLTMFGSVARSCPIEPENYRCVPRCDCIPGFVRINGQCLNPDQCPPDTCIRENEIFKGCGTCDGTCSNPHQECAEACKPGCYCASDCVRDDTGRCILQKNCPVTNITCGTHEVPNMCPDYCTSEPNCPTLFGVLVKDCAAPPPDYHCTPRCECAPGFVRINGSCLTPDKCPLGTCSSENEVFDTCGCDKLCAYPNEACPETCKPGCYCTPGHVRDDYGYCVANETCTAMNITCGTNEVANICPGYCTFDDDCLSFFGGIIRDCAAPPPDYHCTPRCDCLAGFLRINGSCLAPDQCPADSCYRANEVFKGCGTCDASCSNPNPICTTECTPGCYCTSDSVRDENGNCIKYTNCPVVNITCGTNEVLNTCPDFCTFENNCQIMFGGLYPQCEIPSSVYRCTPRCDCASRFVRINGKCVSPDECPVDTTCLQENEVFNKCGTRDGSCTEQSLNYTSKCTPGCYCAIGFLRNADGRCVLKENCPDKCPGQNEIFKSHGFCDGTCDDPNMINPKICESGCFCNTSYVRDANGTCIRIDDCRPNETYSMCGTCDATCKYPRLKCNVPCRTGYFCKTGFVRNKSGVCVNPKSCGFGNQGRGNRIFNHLNTLGRKNKITV